MGGARAKRARPPPRVFDAAEGRTSFIYRVWCGVRLVIRYLSSHVRVFCYFFFVHDGLADDVI